MHRRGDGFWSNGRWYDVNLARRQPLAMPMLEELVMALPPLEAGQTLCDVGAGTGNAAFMTCSAYPAIEATLVDQNPDFLAIAADKIRDIRHEVLTIEATILPDGQPLPGGPYDVVIASLALHEIIGTDRDVPEAETMYELVFQGFRDSLNPGGHLFVADHVGTLGLYRQLKAMERAGFVDVDCAWRQDEYFVCGGRQPA